MTTVHALERQLEAIVARDNLQRAWKRVKANKGAAGVDAISVTDFPAWAREHWPMIKQHVLQGSYQPEAVRRVWIPKPNGDQRPLGIPTVADRVLQQAIAQQLAPLFEREFSDHSYGFRPGRNAHQAVRQVRDYIREKYRVVVDIDLAAFFDSVNHDILMRLIAQRVTDKRVLQLIGRYLRAGVMENGQWQATPQGVPQGGPLSPLLANIVLHELDVYLTHCGHKFARYADDFVICVRSRCAAQRVQEHVKRFLASRLKLSINAKKSRICTSNELEFLGFCFRRNKIVWSDKALHRFKHRIRQLTGRSWGVSLGYRYRELRLYIVGWMNYFALSRQPLLRCSTACIHAVGNITGRCPSWTNGYDGVCAAAIGDRHGWREVEQCRSNCRKQWRWPRTKISHLVSLGVSLKEAIKTGVSSKGPYAMSRTPITQMAMSNEWLKARGLVSIKDQWVRFHYPVSTA